MTGAKRAILYARVSGADLANEGRNLRGQLEMCRKYALAHGWTVIAELAEDDRGASATRLDLPQLNHILERARRREFDVLVVRELDRISRSLPKQLLVEELLSKAGVQIEYVLGDYPDTPEGRFMKYVRGAVAELERLKMQERSERGILHAVRAGSTLVYERPPYGYHVVKRNHKFQLQIREDEARIIRLIFAWFIEGDNDGHPLTLSKIAEKLTGMGVPTYAQSRPQITWHLRYPGRWYSSSVRKILTNRTYKGEWHYRKVRKSNGKRRPATPEEQILVAVPAIVHPATWEIAYEKCESTRQQTQRRRRRSYLLTGFIWCDACNERAFGGISGNGDCTYYTCLIRARPRFYMRTCRTTRFRCEPVDVAVWTWIESLLSNVEVWQAALHDLQTRREEQSAILRAQLAVLHAQVQELESQEEGLLDQYLTRSLDKRSWLRQHATLQRRLEPVRAEQTELQAELAEVALEEEHIQATHRQAAQRLARIPVEGQTYEFKRELFALVDLQVRLCLDAEENHYVQVRCVFGETTFRMPKRYKFRKRRRGQ